MVYCGVVLQAGHGAWQVVKLIRVGGNYAPKPDAHRIKRGLPAGDDVVVVDPQTKALKFTNCTATVVAAALVRTRSAQLRAVIKAGTRIGDQGFANSEDAAGIANKSVNFPCDIEQRGTAKGVRPGPDLRKPWATHFVAVKIQLGRQQGI